MAEYNYTKLLELGQPVAKIQAKHSGRGASAATSDEAGGLEAVLFLSTKAIGRSKGMQKRLEAEKCLKVLAQKTVEKHSSAGHKLSLNSCNV